MVRLVYNLALEQRRDWYRQYRRATGKRLTYVGRARELTALRAAFDWIADVHVTPQQQALRDLETAYDNFFADRARYPRPRRKGVNEAFRFQGREIETRRLNRRWSAVRLPKIGWVKFRDTRKIRGKVKNVTLALAANGWHISFACEIAHVAVPSALPAVGHRCRNRRLNCGHSQQQHDFNGGRCPERGTKLSFAAHARFTLRRQGYAAVGAGSEQ